MGSLLKFLCGLLSVLLFPATDRPRFSHKFFPCQIVQSDALPVNPIPGYALASADQKKYKINIQSK